MRVEINFEKRYVFAIFGAILLLIGVFFVAAASAPNPGHTANEVGSGTFTDSDGTGWIFKSDKNPIIALIDDNADGTSYIQFVKSGTVQFVSGFFGGNYIIRKNPTSKGLVVESTGNVVAEQGLCVGNNANCITDWNQISGNGLSTVTGIVSLADTNVDYTVNTGFTSLSSVLIYPQDGDKLCEGRLLTSSVVFSDKNRFGGSLLDSDQTKTLRGLNVQGNVIDCGNLIVKLRSNGSFSVKRNYDSGPDDEGVVYVAFGS